jgi:hypothetical protein
MNRFLLAPLAAALVLGVQANATTVSINPITASWGNVVGAPVISTGNGTARGARQKLQRRVRFHP